MGLFDFIDGADDQMASPYPSLFTPEQVTQQRRQNLGSLFANMGYALTTRRGLGPAIAAGAMGYQQSKQASDDAMLKRALVGAQVQKAQSEAANNKALGDIAGRIGTSVMGGPASAPGASMPSIPGGTRGGQFNPGNIIDPSGRTTFRSYGSEADGVAALIQNARAYGGGLTLGQIGAKWAPDDDGKNPLLKGNNSGRWARNVAMHGGLRLDQPIDLNDPDTARRFAMGVHAAEYGPSAHYAPEVYARGVSLAGGQPIQPVSAGGGGAPAAAGGTPFAQTLPLLSEPERMMFIGALMKKDFGGAGAIINNANDRILKTRQFDLDAANKPVGADGRPNQGYVDAQTTIARAGATPGAESAYLKGIGENDAKRIAEYQANATGARGTADQVNAAAALLARVPYTGAAGETVQGMRKFLGGLGWKIEGTSEAEVASAILAKLQPTMRAVGSGATSDYEMRIFQQALPSLLNTPAGNQVIADFMERLANRAEQVAGLAGQYKTGLTGTDFDEKRKAFGSLYKDGELDAILGRAGITPPKQGKPAGQRSLDDIFGGGR